MSIRIMVGPVDTEVRNGVRYHHPRAGKFCTDGCANIVPSDEAGDPASSWVLTLGRATDWTAVDADPEIVTLAEAPADVDTAEEAQAWMKAVTLGQLPLKRRVDVEAHFAKAGIGIADLAVGGTLKDLLQRTVSRLMEKDPGFTDGIVF